MPPVVAGAALGAAASTGFALFTGSVALSGAAAFFATSFARSLVFGLVMDALQDKPDFNANDKGITITDRNSTATRKLIYGKRRVGGTIVAIATEDEKDGQGEVTKKNQFLHMIIAVAGHRVDGIENIYFNEEIVSSDAKTFTDANAEYSFALDAGTTYSDANILLKALPGGTNQAVPSELTTAFPNDYTSDHQLNDTAYLYVRMKYDQEIFSAGIPNVTATVRGKQVYDPRTETTAYSDNAALCILDYLLDSEYGLGVAVSELEAANYISAANVCDEDVALDAGGTEKRYTVNGVIDSAVEPRQNIEHMLTAMNGKLVYTKGLFQLYPGVYRTPVETITMDDLIDSVSISTKTSTRQLFNGVKGTFADPTQNYVLTEYPSRESSAYQAVDGYTAFQTLDLPYTTSSATAQRLAKLALNRSRQEISISMQCNLSAIDIVPGDFIYVTNPQLGFDEKVFEVISSGLGVNSDGTLGVSISAQEASAATFDWQATDEEAIIVGTSIYDRDYVVQPPTNLTVTSSLVTQPSNVQEVSWSIDWTDTVTRNLLNYELQWKKSTDTIYTSIYTTENSVSGVGGVLSNESYDVRVRAINNNGAKSAFATASHTMAGGMSQFTDGEDGEDGADGDPGKAGAGTYYFNVGGSTSVTPGQSTLDSYFANVSNSKEKVDGDVLVLRNDNEEVQAYIYNESTGDWDLQTAFIDGDLLVNGTLTADKLKSGNLTTETRFEIGEGVTVSGVDAGAAFRSVSNNKASALVYNTSNNYALVAAAGNSGGVSGATGPAGTFYKGAWSFLSNSYTSIDRYVELASQDYAIFASDDAYIDGDLYQNFSTTGSSSPHFLLFCQGSGVNRTFTDGNLIFQPNTNELGVQQGTGTGTNGAVNASGFFVAGSQVAFTEGHDTLLAKDHGIDSGDIIIDNGIAHKKDISNAIAYGVASTQPNQKAAIGIYTNDATLIPIALKMPNTNQQPGENSEILDPDLAHLLDNYQQARVNSVGEGLMNVCGEGGDIEAGDLIVTSSMAGKGMKQADDIVRGYTVAKARESVTFSSADEVKQIACIYLCG